MSERDVDEAALRRQLAEARRSVSKLEAITAQFAEDLGKALAERDQANERAAKAEAFADRVKTVMVDVEAANHQARQAQAEAGALRVMLEKLVRAALHYGADHHDTKYQPEASTTLLTAIREADETLRASTAGRDLLDRLARLARVAEAGQRWAKAHDQHVQVLAWGKPWDAYERAQYEAAVKEHRESEATLREELRALEGKSDGS